MWFSRKPRICCSTLQLRPGACTQQPRCCARAGARGLSRRQNTMMMPTTTCSPTEEAGMAEDRKDYWAAFAIGAILGVGATLLLMPRQEDTPQRILRRIEPALKR